MENLEKTLNTEIILCIYEEWDEDMIPFRVEYMTVENAFIKVPELINEYSNYPGLIIEACIGGRKGDVFFRYEDKEWFCAKKHPELQKIIDNLNKKF